MFAERLQRPGESADQQPAGRQQQDSPGAGLHHPHRGRSSQRRAYVQVQFQVQL